jgi:periplasmic protein CpxP/Spy
MKLSVLSWSARPTRLFGLALGAALAGGVAFAAWAATGDVPAPRLPPPMMGMMLPRGPMLDRVLDGANVSPAQRAQVHQIFDAAEADLKQARPAERADHEQMQQLFAAPVVDANAVETVRARIEARHDAQSRRVTQAMVDASVVLSAEQRQAIAAQMTAQAHAFGGPRRAASSANE